MPIKTNAGALRGELAPIYRHYPSQTHAQPAYLEIGRGFARAAYNPEIGSAIPLDVWNGVRHRITLNPCLQGHALAEWLEREDTQDLLDRIAAGMETGWDGSNYVGTITDDSMAALEELQNAADEMASDEAYLVECWDADDWINHEQFDEHGNPCHYWPNAVRVEIRDIPATITAATTSDELAEYARALTVMAEEAGVIIDGDFSRVLTAMRDTCRSNNESELPREK